MLSYNCDTWHTIYENRYFFDVSQLVVEVQHYPSNMSKSIVFVSSLLWENCTSQRRLQHRNKQYPLATKKGSRKPTFVTQTCSKQNIWPVTQNKLQPWSNSPIPNPSIITSFLQYMICQSCAAFQSDSKPFSTTATIISGWAGRPSVKWWHSREPPSAVLDNSEQW